MSIDNYLNRIINKDCLEGLRKLPDESIDCCVTSPPYWWLRDYGTTTWEGGDEGCSHKRDSKHSESCSTGQKNLEGAIGDGIYKDVCKRCGAKRIDKQLGLEETPEEFVANLIKWRVAFALQSNGWYLRQDIIWHKPNPMPESVTDRCTKSHEYIFLLSKSAKYYFDNDAIKEKTMQFQDVAYHYKKKEKKMYLNKHDLHKISNMAADNFLNLLCKY